MDYKDLNVVKLGLGSNYKDELLIKNKIQNMWHYTSTDAFIQIVKGRQLRYTDCLFLNDIDVYNHAHNQNIVLYRPKIVCVYDLYVNKSSPLFFASMLVRWASILQDNLDYDSAEAKKKQLDFLSCVSTIESEEIMKYLRKYYN